MSLRPAHDASAARIATRRITQENSMQPNDKSTDRGTPGGAGPKARDAVAPRGAATERGNATDRGKLQGEGDYDAARRHRDSASEYASSHDIEAEARAAAPKTPGDASALLEAERQGRARARGEDRRDVMQDAEIDSPQDDKAT
jgi:hypothetical protein